MPTRRRSARQSSPAYHPAPSPSHDQESGEQVKPPKSASSSFSFKDLSHIVPPFSAPAFTWVEKVRLLTKHVSLESHDLLIDVVVGKLADPLFTQVRSRKPDTMEKLLNSIVQLEHGPPLQSYQRLFNEKWQSTPGQRPSALYVELLTLARQAMPSSSEDALVSLVKAKLLSVLPPSSQALMVSAPKDRDFEELLQMLDTISAPPSPAMVAATSAENKSVGTAIEHKLDEIVARISALETKQLRPLPPRAMPNHENASDTCWYHAKFGAKATRCREPCKFQKNF